VYSKASYRGSSTTATCSFWANMVPLHSLGKVAQLELNARVRRPFVVALLSAACRFTIEGVQQVPPACARGDSC
jgi:hypothetical protein